MSSLDYKYRLQRYSYELMNDLRKLRIKQASLEEQAIKLETQINLIAAALEQEKQKQ